MPRRGRVPAWLVASDMSVNHEIVLDCSSCSAVAPWTDKINKRSQCFWKRICYKMVCYTLWLGSANRQKRVGKLEFTQA